MARVLVLIAGALAGDLLPDGAFRLGGDAGVARYLGGAPPARSGIHDYFITVSALDVDKTGLAPGASPAHTIARATLICPTSGN